ncbi:type I DNA topoisomerase [Spiroplasma chrysopicola]|uniref:DNA topoisomerase 1 n=1 Tax=Spiroplasma chrysopicola DF-1 TaxID=1276227 RepID=R4UH55_9MOLU|nr:type I DNA topoisomerase [Spiroplasma chrysopicola]AGM25510.1 DNA topoisomerase I [Spiroplasma chrysopicola DF-1]
MKYLVVLESPNKISKVKSYLEKVFPQHSFLVKASMGHITELVIKNEKYPLGIELDTMTPIFNVVENKKDTIKQLISFANEVDKVILATDPDREGEAIAWHLQEQLKCQNKTIRLTFNEITEKAIENAFSNPGQLDYQLVNAQQSRQMIDRIMGFKLSNLLQKAENLKSAGRVQSVALKLIVDTELERKEHNKLEYWTIKQEYKDKNEIELYLDQDGKEIVKDKVLNSQEKAEQVLSKITNNLVVKEIIETEFNKNIYNAYTTSGILQDANIDLNYSSEKTTNLLQHLFENGYITYPRTDSTRLNDDFVVAVHKFIATNYGQEYVGQYKLGKNKDNVQDAHEAIRPTNINLTLDKAKKEISNHDEFKLYELIYNNTLYALMANETGVKYKVLFSNNGYTFKLNFKKYHFTSYYDLQEIVLDNFNYHFKVGEMITLESKWLAEQNFTKPSSRYTEHSLIKKLEIKGVGRPSTYATIMKTLINREYIKFDKKSIYPTDDGIKAHNLLQKYFSNIINEKYTADMEKVLDRIADGEINHIEFLKLFYNNFILDFNNATNMIFKDSVKCTKCDVGYIIQRKNYKGNYFKTCNNFPACKNIVS